MVYPERRAAIEHSAVVSYVKSPALYNGKIDPDLLNKTKQK
jgi:hypothetical protein